MSEITISTLNVDPEIRNNLLKEVDFLQREGINVQLTEVNNGKFLFLEYAILENEPELKDAHENQIYKGGEQLGKVKVFRGQQSGITAVVPGEFSAVVRREAKGVIVKSVQLNPMVSAPVRKGQKVGQVIMTIDGKRCGQINLVSATEVKRASIFQIWWQIFKQVIRIGVT